MLIWRSNVSLLPIELAEGLARARALPYREGGLPASQLRDAGSSRAYPHTARVASRLSVAGYDVAFVLHGVEVARSPDLFVSLGGLQFFVECKQ